MANNVGTNHRTRASANWNNQILRRSHGRLDRSIWQEVGRLSQVPASLTLPGGWARIERFQPMASEPLIRVTGLRQTFGNHRVLDGLDLDVRAAAAVAVPGANAARKTTLLQGPAPLPVPTRGTRTIP